MSHWRRTQQNLRRRQHHSSRRTSPALCRAFSFRANEGEEDIRDCAQGRGTSTLAPVMLPPVCGRFTQHLSREEIQRLAELVGERGGERLGAIVVCRRSNCAHKRKGGLRRARLKLATDATAWKRRPLLDARSECGSCLAEPGLRLFAAIFLNCCCEPRPSERGGVELLLGESNSRLGRAMPELLARRV